MRAIPSRDTKPERQLRSALHRLGLRFRKDTDPVPEIRCKADVVFTKKKVCVFVDGCFWHGCPEHYRTPKTNSAWWDEKIQDNVLRDASKSELLEEEGWRVLRFWEHDINARLTECTRTIETALQQRRPK
jgi:DNA mismatch endonuclease (patch repair protein)